MRSICQEYCPLARVIASAILNQELVRTLTHPKNLYANLCWATTDGSIAVPTNIIPHESYTPDLNIDLFRNSKAASSKYVNLVYIHCFHLAFWKPTSDASIAHMLFEFQRALGH